MVALRVEGVSISAVARIEGLAWNTVARWLEKAADVCRGFYQRWTTGFGVEVAPGRRDSLLRRRQDAADVDIHRDRSLVPSLAIDPSSSVETYRNTLALLRDVANRMDWERLPLIVTDAFDFYEKSVTESVASLVRRLCTARCSRRAGMIVS